MIGASTKTLPLKGEVSAKPTEGGVYPHLGDGSEVIRDFPLRPSGPPPPSGGGSL